MTARNDVGVRVRVDGKGDPWANAHRQFLGREHVMNDVDAFFGAVVFGGNTGDRLFVEYVPDAKFDAVAKRQYGLLAMWDRKRSRSCIKPDSPSTGLYLWMCRAIRDKQPIAPRFFYVFGVDFPFEAVELNIDTGDQVGDSTFMPMSKWENVWKSLGLLESRNRLADWIRNHGGGNHDA